MPNSCRIALKEWAVVVDALGRGRQTILLRKGGIREKGGAFEPEHRDFLLYPTAFHQNPEELIPDARPDLARIQAQPRDAAVIRFEIRATVEAVFRIEDPARLEALAPFHILAPETVAARFRYRKPGLHVLLLRVCRLPAVVTVPERKAYEGCVSWVDLGEELRTEKGTPVLDDEAFARMAKGVKDALGI